MDANTALTSTPDGLPGPQPTATPAAPDCPAPSSIAPTATGQPLPAASSTSSPISLASPADTPDSEPPSAPLQSERSSPGSSSNSVPDQDSSIVSASQSLPSERDHEEGHGPSGESPSSAEDHSSDGEAAGPGGSSDGEERLIDSDREVVEEEDAFGDFADFTTASHFLPGGGLGAATLPPPASRAAGAGPSSATSPSGHRHAHLSSTFPARPGYGVGTGGHGGSVSGAVSEHGSFGGDFSDFSHPSPPPSVVRAGGRKSVASIASVGSRAGGDDDLGDYGSVVGSSVWRAPSQMATSSYAAAAGADDDFGDFTSDITSTSDFAPSTQPPSAVAVSGPGSVHPDDDFGSFASHRSTADDDEDDFGNFNAAPAGGAAGAASGSGGGPSAAAGGAAGAGGSLASGVAAAVAAGGSGPPAGAAGAGGPGALSPRDAAAAGGAVAGSHAFHSTQTVSLPGTTDAITATAAAAVGAAESALLQLARPELRQAVARALQPLLSPGAVPLAAATAAAGQVPAAIPEEQWSAAWAQLQRHVVLQAGRGEANSVAVHTGLPWVQLSGLGDGAVGSAAAGAQECAALAPRVGYAPAFRYTRALRWKGSDSERRLLASLGLSEAAAQARAAEAAAAAVEGPPRVVGRLRSETAGGSGLRHQGMLASYGDVPPRLRARAQDTAAAPGGC